MTKDHDCNGACYTDKELVEILSSEDLDYYRKTNSGEVRQLSLSHDLAAYLNKKYPTRTYRMHPISVHSECVARKMHGVWKYVDAEQELNLGVAIMLYRKKLIQALLNAEDIEDVLEGKRFLWETRPSELDEIWKKRGLNGNP